MARRATVPVELDEAQRAALEARVLTQVMPAGDPDAAGRMAVTLPDLPQPDNYWVKSKTRMTLILTSGHDKVPDLLIPPNGEMHLPRPGFWLMHDAFRGRMEDTLDADGKVVALATLAVYKRAGKVVPPAPVPEALACPPGQEALVELLCAGNMEDPDLDLPGLITMTPLIGDQPKRLDVAYVEKTWRRVLSHALWNLNDKRKRGLEVDQRRIDLIENRIAWCDEKLREAR